MAGPARRVLMLAYRYPPCRAHPTAAARSQAFARHLSDFGWVPTVLTPDLPEGFCGLASCRHEGGPAALPAGRVAAVPVEPLRRARLRPRVRGAVLRRLVDASLAGRRFPNDWSAVAAAQAQALHAGEPFDLLWVTAGPFAQVGLGESIAATLGIPWVVDLRDPVSRILGGSGLRRRIERRQRTADIAAVRRADGVIHATEGFAREDKAVGVTSDVAIRHGFDPDLWTQVRAQPRPRQDHLDVVYAGRFYPGEREPGPIVEALRILATTRPDLRDQVRLSYFGPTPGLLLEAAAHAGVSDLVIDRGHVSPTEVPSALHQADVNLLLTNMLGIKDWPGGKFVELVAAGRPILVLPDLDDWITEVVVGRGLGVAARDAAEGAKALVELVERWQTDTLDAQSTLDEVHDMSSHGGAGELASVLDRVVTAAR